MGDCERSPSATSSSRDRKSLTITLIELALYGTFTYLCFRSLNTIIQNMDPMNKNKQGVAKTKEALKRKLKRTDVIRMELSEYEKVIADEVLDPEDIDGGFDSIGGLEAEKREIYELVVLPLKRPDLFNQRGRLLASPKGILFYGQPGTGKTLLAKAIAKESGATFMNLRLSVLMNKYFGESNKLVSAVFTLAYKLQPCIIFIDEIDSFLRQRGGVDDTAWVSLKAEFMTLWDGLLTESNTPIIVLGATNRPYDLDQAILRRLPRQFEIPLPSRVDRAKILTLLLANEKVDPSISMDELAALTEGYSGSDLKEACRAAVILPLREVVPYAANGGSLSTLNVRDLSMDNCRPVNMKDFHTALERVRATGVSAREYREREYSAPHAPDGETTLPPAVMNAAIMAMIQHFLQSIRQSDAPAAL